MVLVFILLGILILILFFIFLLLSSTLSINIKELIATNIPVKQPTHYNINISLKAFNYIKWISITLNEKKVKEILEKPFAKIEFKKLEKDFKLEDIKVLKKLIPEIVYLNLNADLGLESPVVTAFSISTIASLISIILPSLAKKQVKNLKKVKRAKLNNLYINNKNENKYKYHITPIFQNRNLYKISLNCIIQLKMVHIINVIYIFSKKGRSDENERATSNRKSYGYSNE